MSEIQPNPARDSKRHSKTTISKATSTVREAAVRPRHIVVFPAPSEKNVERTATILGARETPGMSARSSLSVMAARHPGHAQTRVFHRLGVATADLTPDEVDKFERLEGVRVVENETRRLPPMIEVASTAIASELPGAAADPSALAYLMGLRDGLDTALRRLGGRRGLSGTPGSESSTAMTTDNWCLASIRLGTANRQATGKGVRVAVLDTGLDIKHPDFAKRVIATESFVAGEQVQDLHGHGTHCAGILSGPLQSAGSMVYGVAPEVDLMVGKVLDRHGRGKDDQILDAIDWAVDGGARIISMSLGSRRQPGDPIAVAYETVARTLLQNGVLIVAAAGNDSNRPWWTSAVGNPAACPSILAVAAVERSLAIASFSCRQMDDTGRVDIAAPGVGVHSSWINSGFKSISGTSMATPHVAGIAALLAEKGGKGASGKNLWDLLLAGAHRLGDSEDFGAGIVQAP